MKNVISLKVRIPGSNLFLTREYKQRCEQNPKFFSIIVHLSARFNLDKFCSMFCNYVQVS
jgi:hypothetical protein